MDVQYADVTGLQAPPRISTYTIGPFQSSKIERSKVKVKARLDLHGIVSVASTQGEATKKKVKKSNIPLWELVHGGMLPADVQKATEKESEMALKNRTMEGIKDKKIALESFLYDTKNKLHHNLLELATDADREALSAKLEETADWLQRDWLRGDETERAYIAKLEELKKV